VHATTSTTQSTSLAPLYWLALGTFAVGTESFMIAGLLPDMAADLHTSIVATGQLVTVFALAYALSSPILTALTGAFHRRTLMILSLSAFTVANIIAWGAQNYWELMAARILLAAAAGLYVPGANALAGAIAGPERRGTALAIVNGGITIAVAFGVPPGAVVGDRLGWRMTFAGVAALSAAATAGLLLGLPRNIGAGLPVATLRERIDVARQPVILMTSQWQPRTYAQSRLRSLADLHLSPRASSTPSHSMQPLHCLSRKSHRYTVLSFWRASNQH
jgi:predicted MFS family arabinose efflux permease